MQLKATAETIIDQIIDLTSQLNDAEYAAELELLNGNTIGKHVRHVVEFFDLLVSGIENNRVNYDKRKHEPLYETSTEATLNLLKKLKAQISRIPADRSLILEVSYADKDQDYVQIKSSLEREIAYNIEHAIHHMAIIKIAMNTVFPQVKLADNFGIAYSTVRYQQVRKQ